MGSLFSKCQPAVNVTPSDANKDSAVLFLNLISGPESVPLTQGQSRDPRPSTSALSWILPSLAETHHNFTKYQKPSNIPIPSTIFLFGIFTRFSSPPFDHYIYILLLSTIGSSSAFFGGPGETFQFRWRPTDCDCQPAAEPTATIGDG